MDVKFRVKTPSEGAPVGVWWRHIAEVLWWYGWGHTELVGALKASTAPTTPREWVRRAMAFTIQCPKCGGSGQWTSKTSSGVCFACNGQGSLDHKARKRNLAYWDINTSSEARAIKISGSDGLVIRDQTV